MLAERADDVRIEHLRVDTLRQAEDLGFRGSPTVFIDGTDPFEDEAAPIGLSCRLYRTPDGLSGSPTSEQLRTAL